MFRFKPRVVRQMYDSPGGGSGRERTSPSPSTDPNKNKDQAHEPDDSKTTEEWENDKLPEE